MTASLDDRFEAEMWRIHNTAKERCPGYRGTRFAQMIQEHGGVQTAKRLLAGAEIHDGFAELALCGCLDLTSEALALDPAFETLFTEGERREAARRLGRPFRATAAPSGC